MQRFIFLHLMGPKQDRQTGNFYPGDKVLCSQIGVILHLKLCLRFHMHSEVIHNDFYGAESPLLFALKSASSYLFSIEISDKTLMIKVRNFVKCL